MPELSEDQLLVNGAGELVEGKNARLIAPLEGEAAYASETTLRQWAEEHGASLLDPADTGLPLSELPGFRIVDLSSGASYEVEDDWVVVGLSAFEAAVGSWEDPEGAVAYALKEGRAPVAPTEATGLEPLPSQPVVSLD